MRLAAAVLVVVVVVAVQPCAAMIGRDVELKVTPEEFFTLLWSFEADTGGLLSWSFDLKAAPAFSSNETSLQVMLCADEQIDLLRTARREDVCGTPRFSYVKCPWQAQLFAEHPHASVDLVVPRRSWYRLLQLNCAEEDWTMTLNWRAENPGGEFLSLAEVPYKKMFLYLLAFWLVLDGVWASNLYRYCALNTDLQRTFLAVPLAQAVLCGVLTAYWREASRSGVFPTALSWLVLVTEGVAQAALFVCVALTARGWRVLVRGLEHRDYKIILFASCGIVIAQAFYGLFASLILFVVVVVYAVALRFVFAGLVVTVSRLGEQAALLRRHDIPLHETAIMIKIRLYKRWQSAVVLFLLFYLVLRLWATVFLASRPWLASLLQHACVAGFCIYTATLFRLRPFVPFLYPNVPRHYWEPGHPPPDVSCVPGGDQLNLPVVVVGGRAIAAPLSDPRQATSALLAVEEEERRRRGAPPRRRSSLPPPPRGDEFGYAPLSNDDDDDDDDSGEDAAIQMV